MTTEHCDQPRPRHPLARADRAAVSALGVGTWALGGPWTFHGRAAGSGQVHDAVSVPALHPPINHGVTLFDTAPCYGTGHSKRVLGRALAELPASTRDPVVVATKFGLVFDEPTRSRAGERCAPGGHPGRVPGQPPSPRPRAHRPLPVAWRGGYRRRGRDGGAGLGGTRADGQDPLVRHQSGPPEIIEVFARSPH